MDTQFQVAIDDYVSHIKSSYINWQSLDPVSDPVRTKIREEMCDRFVNGVTVEVGSKYVKIVSNGSVHSFIVLKDGKFSRGTILKAASWRAPATNFSRGNVLAREFNRVTWTGAI